MPRDESKASTDPKDARSAVGSRTPEARQPLYEAVSVQIFNRIADGRYATGDKLPTEAELANEFQVSRVTVRLALEKLRRQRLVVSVQGSGNYVGGVPDFEALTSGLGEATRDDLQSLRVALETEAAALAAENRTADHVGRLQELLVEHEGLDVPELESIVKLRLVDLEFHETIRLAAANPILIAALEPIVPQFTKHWLTTDKDDILGDIARIKRIVSRDHTAIADAIIAGDAEAARREMRQHLDVVRDWANDPRRAQGRLR